MNHTDCECPENTEKIRKNLHFVVAESDYHNFKTFFITASGSLMISWLTSLYKERKNRYFSRKLVREAGACDGAKNSGGTLTD